MSELVLVECVTFVGYTELQLSDRIHLLEACWMEVLIIGLLSKSAPHAAASVLVFAPDLHMDK